MTTSARRRRGRRRGAARRGVEACHQPAGRVDPARTRDEVAEADRPERWPGGRDGRVADEARERLQAVLALARTGQGAGPALDQLGVGVARGHLRPDLPGADVLAEADDRTAGDASPDGCDWPPSRVARPVRRPRPVPRRRRARRPQRPRDGRSPGPHRQRPVHDRPIGRRSDREQRRNGRPTGRIERRDERCRPAARRRHPPRGRGRGSGSGRRRRRGRPRAVCRRPPSRTTRRGHALATADRDERIGRRSVRSARPHRHRPAASPARAISGPDPTSRTRSPGRIPNRSHQADDGPRRHDARPVRTRYERDAVVRAGRRHDRAGPDLEMRVRRDRA